MENKHLQDSMNMMKLMNWTVDDCGEKVYTKGESTEDQCKDGGPGSGIKGHTTNDPDIQYKEFMKGKKKPLTYSEGKKLLEEAKKAGIHEDYLKGMERGLANLKDDDATEMGTFEQLGQNHETEAMELEEHPVLAQDDEVGEKFKTVMEEFGKGELKSSSGEKVTDPKQAKAIAYSEQREANDGGEGSGVKGHHTAEEDIEQIKSQKLRVILSNLGKAIESGKKPKYAPFPERSLSKSLEEERADINRNHPGLKTPKLNKEIAEAKKKESKDSDPKVAEAMKIINLSGGAM